MAQSGYTPILIYASGTASNVPLAANLTSSASGAELALNYADGKLYFKNSSGVVTLLAGAGGAGVVAGSNTQIQFNNSGVFGASANLTWSGTVLSTTGLTATGAITLNTTTNNQSYTTTGAGTITISSGTAGSINNMNIGATTAGTGTFTNLTYTGTLTGSTGVIAIGTNQIYKDSSGNVGIGTSAPGYKLDVTRGSVGDIARFTNGVDATLVIGAPTGGVTYNQLNGGYQAWQTAGTERMRIDSSGNVGIGTSSGAARLNVNGGTSTSQIRWEVNNAAFTQEVSTNAAVSAYVYKSNDASYHVWKLSSSEAMRLDSSGNVGIGTSSPNLSSSSTALTVNTGTAANYSAFELASGGTLNYHINANNSAVYHVAAGTRPWVVYTNGSERMRIDSSGNVGVGTSSPATTPKMTVQGGGANGSGGIRILSDTSFSNGANYQAYGRRGDGNPSGAFAGGTLLARVNTAPAALTSGINLGRLGFGGSYDGTDANVVYGAQITGQASGTYSSASAATDLVFYTTPSGTAGGTTTGTADFGSERMRIDSSGNVNIGAAATTAAAGGRVFDIYNLENTNSSSYALTRLITYNVAGTTTVSADIFKNKAGSFVFNNNETNAAAATSFGIGGSERMRIDSSGNVLVTNAAGLGYGTGSGGTVTQATSKSTGVTLNKPTGQITMNAAALGSGATVNFSLSNTLLAEKDNLILNITNASAGAGTGGGNYNMWATPYAGGTNIWLKNISAGSLSEALVINFSIIKGATA